MKYDNDKQCSWVYIYPKLWILVCWLSTMWHCSVFIVIPNHQKFGHTLSFNWLRRKIKVLSSSLSTLAQNLLYNVVLIDHSCCRFHICNTLSQPRFSPKPFIGGNAWIYFPFNESTGVLTVNTKTQKCFEHMLISSSYNLHHLSLVD